jgi:hypothetical protein
MDTFTSLPMLGPRQITVPLLHGRFTWNIMVKCFHFFLTSLKSLRYVHAIYLGAHSNICCLVSHWHHTGQSLSSDVGALWSER